MGIPQASIDTHWEYFLAVENDLELSSRFVQFDSENYKTFSVEFAKIIQLACADADTLFKEVCKQITPKSEADGINNYFDELRTTNIGNIFVRIPRYALSLRPFSSWTANAAPKWWTAANKLKHQRGDEYKRANLKNALNSVAGIFVLNLYRLRDPNSGRLDTELFPEPKLFFPSEEQFDGRAMHNHLCITYKNLN